MDRPDTETETETERAHDPSRRSVTDFECDIPAVKTGLGSFLARRSSADPVLTDPQRFSATPGRLRRLGLRVDLGHSEPRASRSAGLSHRRDNASTASRPRSITRLLANRRVIGIVGGRSASAAGAMVGWTLSQAGMDPALFLKDGITRAVIPTKGDGIFAAADLSEVLSDFAPGQGPEAAVLLGRLTDATAKVEALERFAASLPAGGYVLSFPGDPVLDRVLEESEAEVERLSLEGGHAWWAADVREDRGFVRFRAFHHGRFALEMRLSIPGRRYVLSALAAIAVCRRINLEIPEIRKALEEFEGLSRNVESRGSYRGVSLIDDDSKTLTDVSEAIRVTRAMCLGRRLWVVVFADGIDPDAWEALSKADHVMIVGRIRCVGPAERLGNVRPVRDLDQALDDLDRSLEPGDVLITLGTGDVGLIADEFLRRLPRRRSLR